MNIAVTEAIDLTPPGFVEGLADWSSTDGTPASPTYDNDPTASLVASDPDFGACLELSKDTATKQLRYMGEVPLLPGTYLEVSVRIKVISGAFPTARIGGWPGEAGGAHVAGLTEQGPVVAPSEYGRVYAVRAIIGGGHRTGVDMVWGSTPDYGHFGLDLGGDVGSVIRVESVEIRDVTSYFHRKMMDWVDVRDFGALGDGSTDDSAAFEAADAAAAGRELLVSAGVYYLAKNCTLNARCRFEGRVVMPDDKRLALTNNFDLPTYVDAFGSEPLGLKKALQALFNYSDHESLDMCGLRVQLDAPLDVAAAVANKDTFANRRVLRNGQIEASSSAAWTPAVVTASARYSSADNLVLTDVSNIGAIEVGALVAGPGVGREIYVRAKDDAAATMTLSQPLHSAAGLQTYTFTRFRYLLDFSGFDSLQRFQIEDVEFLCNGAAGAVMLPRGGKSWHIRDCWFTKPADRGITSIGDGCNGICMDGNEFISDEYDTPAQDRTTVAFNTNKNDIKVRDNRAVRFRHFGVVNGGGHIFSGNHFWQGDETVDGERSAGLVLTQKSCKTTIVGNYIDNCWIELNNEHDVKANATASSRGFGTLSITGNIFTANDVPAWFAPLRLAPYGDGYWIDGITVHGNAFKVVSGNVIDRVDTVDTAEGSIDHAKTVDLHFSGNSFDAVLNRSQNPARIRVARTGALAEWTVACADKLPFGGCARAVDSVMPQGPLNDANGVESFAPPRATPGQGADKTDVTLHWPAPVSGTVDVFVRSDLPA